MSCFSHVDPRVPQSISATCPASLASGADLHRCSPWRVTSRAGRLNGAAEFHNFAADDGGSATDHPRFQWPKLQ